MLELAAILHFNFTFKLVDDGAYGSEIAPGKYNGMLGEVRTWEDNRIGC